MPEDPQDVKAAVVDWLSKEGYRLEYQTQKALQDSGLNAVMSYFVDSAEGKPGEIDVSALHEVESAGNLQIRVFCECKYSVDKPWILMYSGLGSHIVADWVSIPKSPNLKELTDTLPDHAEELRSCWHFAKKQPFAHTLIQAFRKENKDVAYESLYKISYAAWDSVEANLSEDPGCNRLTIPCLIVEAPLLGCRFNHDAKQFEIMDIPYGRLSWGGCRNGTSVDVVSLAAIADYAKGMKKTVEVLSSVVSRMLVENKRRAFVKRRTT